MQLIFYLRKRNFILTSVSIFVLFLFSLTTQAAEVTLQWDRPNDNNVTGYHVYCGKSSTDFKSTLCATVSSANTTTCTVPNLEAGFEYSFVSTSFSSNGNQSDFSNTISMFINLPYDETDDDGDGYTEKQGDCNDSDALISPAATEICGDGIDQDCNGNDLPCDTTGVTTLLFSDMPGADYTGAIQDTFINLNRDANGSANQLNTYTWPENRQANAILIKIDLSPIPQGAIIQDALLTLYQTEAAGDTTYDVSVHKIINHNPSLAQANGYTYDGTTDWTANNNCYNNIPLAQADIAPAENVNILDLALGYKGWNVTRMVQDWVNDAAANYGLLLNSDAVASANSHRFFASNETTDSTHRPALIVRYTLPSNDVDNDGDGFTVNQGDCNDNDSSIAPNAVEICGDDIDQDCDGSDLICPEDIDDDGDGSTENQGDCNDSDPAVHPGATEICGDGIDQDCSGADLICPEDVDDDGDGYTENQGDCNDGDALIGPAGTEICGDGIDQDCNGSDLACTTPPGTVTDTMIFGNIPGSDDSGNIQDTFININQDVNSGLNQLNTYTWPTNKPANAVLIKFDLSKLPKGAKIQNATLTLYQTSAGGDADYDVSVHKIINHNPDLQHANGYTYNGVDNWTANTLCYNNIPLAQFDIAPAENVNHLDLSLGYKAWDITKMVQEWATDSASNFGLLLNSDAVAGSNSFRFFASNEAGDPAQRPGLEIMFSLDAKDVDSDGDGYTPNQGDCNDNNAQISPNGTEICGDGIDQDCSGADLDCSAVSHTAVFGNVPNADFPTSIQDTFININRDVNVALNQLNTYTWPTNKSANAVLIKFDLSGLPQGAKIQSATLKLYQTSAGGDADYDVSVHKIINHNPDLQRATGYTYNGVDSWTANQECYRNIPLAQADLSPAEDVNRLDLSLGYKSWNVTGMVREWTQNSASNFGLLLNSDAVAGSNSFRFFAASEAGNADQRPALEVVYTIE